LRAKLLAYGGLVQDDYEKWIVESEGHLNKDTPFGLLQSETLINDRLHSNAFSKYFFPTRQDEATIYLLQKFTQATQKPKLPTVDLIAYCDGSYNALTKTGGTGLYFQDPTRHLEVTGGTKYLQVFSSFQAELLALKDTLHQLISVTPPPKEVLILSDSMSLLSNISNWPLQLHICETIAQLLDLAHELLFQKHISLHLAWIPGHRGVHGNEMADSFARKSQIDDAVPTELLPIQLNYFHIRAKAHVRVQINDSKLCSFNFTPTLRRTLIQHPHPAVSKMISRILSDHHALNGRIIHPDAPDELCGFCRSSILTLNHLLQCHHPLIENLRHLLEAPFHTAEYLTVSMLIQQPKIWTKLHTLLLTIQLHL
jgi:ribonuclease HI